MKIELWRLTFNTGTFDTEHTVDIVAHDARTAVNRAIKNFGGKKKDLGICLRSISKVERIGSEE